MKITPVIISFFSLEWIKFCLDRFFHYLPEFEVLAVDNNPLPGKVFEKAWWFDFGLKTCDRWIPECEEERQFLKSHNKIQYLQMPQDNRIEPISHGEVLDFVVSHLAGKTDLLVLLEPDCLIGGRCWFDMSLQKIKDGFEVVGVEKDHFVDMAGSFWLFSSIDQSFQTSLKDFEDIRFREGLACRNNWDTGHKLFTNKNSYLFPYFEDFKHYQRGSWCQNFKKIQAGNISLL